MSRKGENIYKRKDKRWEARYVKGYGEDGQPKYGYLYAQSYHAVREKLEHAKINLALGEPLGSICDKRFCVQCDEWLSVNQHKVAASTYAKYEKVLNKHIKAQLGGLRTESISTAVVARFSDTLLTEQGLSPKTARDILTILGSILKYAQKKIGSKMQNVEIIYPKCTKKEMRVLTHAEQKKLVTFLLSDMDEYKFGILLALLTGIRIGELCALRWNCFSFEERCIRVRATMQRLANCENPQCNTKVMISNPKSSTSARLIPLTDIAVSLCKRFCPSNASAFVLTGDSERYCEPRKLQYRFSKITEELGLHGVHFHSLRHTFATRCVEVGFEIKSLSEILGHASPKITLERYVHSSIELKRDNMKKLSIVSI